MSKSKKRKGPGGNRKKKKLRWLARCDGCGLVQPNTKAHPPPELPRPRPPILAASRFVLPGDWVAHCRRCPSETAVYVKVAA